MPDPLLEITGLNSGYGDVQVLWGIDLAFDEGQIVCLVGSNGAGKTTLLRTISGICPATGGRITFDGKDITSAESDAVLRAGIAHVPEGRRLFKGLTVRDNLLLGAYHRNDKEGIAEDLELVLGALSDIAGTPSSGCLNALRWSATNVRDRKGHNVAAQTPHD